MNIEFIPPNPELLEIVRRVLDLNKAILAQNELLIKSLASPMT